MWKIRHDYIATTTWAFSCVEAAVSALSEDNATSISSKTSLPPRREAGLGERPGALHVCAVGPLRPLPGHRRNTRMIHRRDYVGCVAFPLGLSAGTRGCIVAAADAAIPVWNRGQAPSRTGLYRGHPRASLRRVRRLSRSGHGLRPDPASAASALVGPGCGRCPAVQAVAA